MPGGRREDESEVNRKSQHLSRHADLPPSLAVSSLSTIRTPSPQPTLALPKYDISYLPISRLIFGSSFSSLPSPSLIFNAAVSCHLDLSRVSLLHLALDFSSAENYTFTSSKISNILI